MFNKFSNPLKNTILIAQGEAYLLNCEDVTPEHLLLALIRDRGDVGALLRELVIETNLLRQRLWSGNYDAERLLSDIAFSSDARIVMQMASDFSAADGTGEVSNAHVLKALLVEDSSCAVVELLKSLESAPDLQILRRRTDTILKLTPRSEGDSESKTAPDGVSTGTSEGIANKQFRSMATITDYFDEKSTAIIVEARLSACALGHSEVGIKDLLVAFSHYNELSGYVSEVLALLGDDFLPTVSFAENEVDCTSVTALAAETKQAFLKSHELAATFYGGLISPSILLYGTLKQTGSFLFEYKPLNEVVSEKFFKILKRLNDEIIDSIDDKPVSAQCRQRARKSLSGSNTAVLSQPAVDLETGQVAEPERNSEIAHEASHLMVTQRLARVLRYAKDEVVLARQSYVEAPHIVLAMIREAFFSEIAFVKNRAFDVDQVRAKVCKHQKISAEASKLVEPVPAVKFGPDVRGILLAAMKKADNLRVDYVDLNHLAVALLESEDWLTEIISSCTDTSPRSLIYRLNQCSLQQYHLFIRSITEPSSYYSSSIGVVLNLDDLDTQIEQSESVDLQRAIPERRIEDRLSSRSEVVMGFAVLESRKLGLSRISVETIMLGLLYETFGPSYEVLKLFSLNLEDARALFKKCCARGSERTAATRPLSGNALRLMEKAWGFAQIMKLKEIDPEHILLAIIEEEHGVASFVCEALLIDGKSMRSELISAMSWKNRKLGVAMP